MLMGGLVVLHLRWLVFILFVCFVSGFVLFAFADCWLGCLLLLFCYLFCLLFLCSWFGALLVCLVSCKGLWCGIAVAVCWLLVV